MTEIEDEENDDDDDDYKLSEPLWHHKSTRR